MPHRSRDLVASTQEPLQRLGLGGRFHDHQRLGQVASPLGWRISPRGLCRAPPPSRTRRPVRATRAVGEACATSKPGAGDGPRPLGTTSVPQSRPPTSRMPPRRHHGTQQARGQVGARRMRVNAAQRTNAMTVEHVGTAATAGRPTHGSALYMQSPCWVPGGSPVRFVDATAVHEPDRLAAVAIRGRRRHARPNRSGQRMPPRPAAAHHPSRRRGRRKRASQCR